MRIVGAWEAGDFEICISPVLVHELTEVRARPEIARAVRLTSDQAREFVQLIAEASLQVMKPLVVQGSVPSDPDDDAVLATALGAGADVIVSGLGTEGVQRHPILTPRLFLDLLAE